MDRRVALGSALIQANLLAETGDENGTGSFFPGTYALIVAGMFEGETVGRAQRRCKCVCFSSSGFCSYLPSTMAIGSIRFRKV
jgi:hypothetical protein